MPLRAFGVWICPARVDQLVAVVSGYREIPAPSCQRYRGLAFCCPPTPKTRGRRAVVLDGSLRARLLRHALARSLRPLRQDGERMVDPGESAIPRKLPLPSEPSIFWPAAQSPPSTLPVTHSDPGSGTSVPSGPPPGLNSSSPLVTSQFATVSRFVSTRCRAGPG